MLFYGQIVQQVEGLLCPLPAQTKIERQVVTEFPIILHIPCRVFFLEVELGRSISEVVRGWRVRNETTEVGEGVAPIYIGKESAGGALRVKLSAKFDVMPAE